MATFTPSPEDLRQTIAALERSEKKFRRWREETELYQGLYCNDPQTFNADSPGGQNALGRNDTTTVVRNGINFAVYANVRRKQIKDSRFSASPEISMIQRPGPNGQPITVEGEFCAYAQSEILTYAFRQIRFMDQMPPMLEQGEIGNEGWMKLVTWNGADAPETLAWVESASEADDETSLKKIKTHRPINSLANSRFPGIIWVSNEDVICDADAIMDHEMNRITHRCVKPLSAMKSAMVDDYELKLDPDSGKLKVYPVMDEFGDVKQRKKYQNLDGLIGNYDYYLQKRMGGRKKKGDIRNEFEILAEREPKDYLVFFEENGRFPADSEIVKKEFGGVPKTIDGFVYFWKVTVEDTKEGGGGDGPTLIRFEWCPVDIGGFHLKRYQPRPKAGSQKGFSWIRNAHEALALENYWDSYDTAWYAAVKIATFIDSTVIDSETWKTAMEGGHWDAIFTNHAGNKSIRDAVYQTQFTDRPQGIDGLKMRMRAIQDESSGTSANQRMMTSGDQSATQSSIIDQNASDQAAFDIEIVKRFVECIAHAWMRLFVASLPENGRFEIPGSEGGFVQFDRMNLDLDCAYRLEYSSFQQAPNPVENKQLQELIQAIINTPPQLWAKMRPFWEAQAMAFKPAVMAAFRKFEKLAFGETPDTDPMKEHNLMAMGMTVEPDQNENFIDTIPQHEKMLKDVTALPVFAAWNDFVRSKDPKLNGKVPFKLLILHIAESKKLAIAKGMGPALGLMGDQAGSQRKERGSGPESGRLSQDQAPDAGSVESGAMKMEV